MAAATRATASAKRVRGPQSRGARASFAGAKFFMESSSPRKRGPITPEPSSDQIREIPPFQVVLFNELNFPIPVPFLQLLLPHDGLLSPFIRFDIDQTMDAIFANER